MSNIEIKVKGFLKTALSSEASTAIIDVDFVNEDDSTEVIELQSDTLIFDIDPLNKTGKGSELIKATSNTFDSPVTNRTRLATVARGLDKFGASLTGNAANAKSWDVGTEVAIATGSMAKVVNKHELLLDGSTQLPAFDVDALTAVTIDATGAITAGSTIDAAGVITTPELNINDGNTYIKENVGGDMLLKDANNGEVTLATLISATSDKVLNTAADTTSGYVDDKITVNTGIKKTTQNPAGNENTLLEVDITDTDVFVSTSSGAADENHVALLNASGQFDTGFVDLSTTLGIGGDASDGVLNVTSGTTNITTGVKEYASVNVSSGATLSTASTTGVMQILCRGDFVLAGTIDLSGKNIATSAESVLLVTGSTYDAKGAKGGNGGGGGGGCRNIGGLNGGDGGAGSGGGAGGDGGDSGSSAYGGTGGASTGGSTTLGAGGAGKLSAVGIAGGSSAGGGGSSVSGGAGGGAGNPAGADDGTISIPAGTGFGANGGGGNAAWVAGGGGSGGQGGYGGIGLVINTGGKFTGTGGAIDTSGAAGQAGGNGGSSTSTESFGGGGGGGGNGGVGGNIRIITNDTYVAPTTITMTGGSAGANGAGGTGTFAAWSGDAGSAGSAGGNGSLTALELGTIY